jgi:WS/DGAT/MGAT family acyltransferase
LSYTHYQRLTALDATFLEIEEPSVHMHVGAVAIFDNAPALRTPEGALDIERVRAYIDGALHEAPRFRQCLDWIPFVKHPIWIDDARFKIRYHVRHTALPAPGGLRQLKRLAGRIMSQKLDRAKPMWEMWIVEGLENDRFALILKAHHCMVDGISGIDLLAAILRLEPEVAERQHARTWIPRGRPTGLRLLADEVGRRACVPWKMARSVPHALSHPIESVDSVRDSVLGVVEAIGAGFVRTSATPLNPDIGPYRKYDWTEFDIGEIKAVREVFGGTLNDVVLSTVAGAIGQFLRRRGESVGPDTVFRVMVPVSIRTKSERGEPGNRVVNFFARLPIHERDARRRLELTAATVRELKGSRLVAGTEAIEEVSNLTFTGILVEFARLAALTRTYNLVVTNVPGPPMPIYFMGARLQSIYPLVPLFNNQALGIALFSYAGKLCWGLNADWDAVPDLHDVVLALEDEFAVLREAARVVGGNVRREAVESAAHTNGGGAAAH